MAPTVSNIHPRRILVRGVNWLGDAVMTTPALLRLRERFPDAHVTMLTPAKLRDLWQNHPAVNETFSIETGEILFSVAKRIRAGDFDTALVLPNSPRSAMEAWLAGIPNRIGYARPWRNFFLTTAVRSRPDAIKMRKRSVSEIQELASGNAKRGRKSLDVPATAHQVHDFLHLVGALGAIPDLLPPQLRVAPEEIELVRKKFGLENISQPIFGLNAGAEYGPAKRWPKERFAEAAKEIQKQTNCFWLLFGGKGDVEIARSIENQVSNRDIRNLAGQTSLRELMALLKLCRIVLTNDTGPMHLAAALGVPVVVPFGSTSPELTGPISSAGIRHQLIKSDAPCAPCFLRECPIDFRCMLGINVERVVQAVCESAAQ